MYDLQYLHICDLLISQEIEKIFQKKTLINNFLKFIGSKSNLHESL